MANFDAGHYFLTVAAPIDRDGKIVVDGQTLSVINSLRGSLAELATSQEELSDTRHQTCCFAKVPGTHFVRFFVLGDVRYNGRRPSNPIYDLLFNVQMTKPEKVDHLPDAYLMMMIDFDASDGSDASLRNYLDDLWNHASDEMVQIFRHSLLFKDLNNAADFLAFIKHCQIGTTMPFNDYWTSELPVPNPLPLFAAIALAVPALALLVWTRDWWPWEGWWLGALTIATILTAIVGLTLKRGLTPFPTAPDSDLASVLKALYVQQMFTGFMIDNLGRGGQDLFDAFQTFRETHRPANLPGPTQPAGVLVSERVRT